MAVCRLLGETIFGYRTDEHGRLLDKRNRRLFFDFRPDVSMQHAMSLLNSGFIKHHWDVAITREHDGMMGGGTKWMVSLSAIALKEAHSYTSMSRSLPEAITYAVLEVAMLKKPELLEIINTST